MRVIAIIIVSFIGFYAILHICSKNNYAIEYTSDKRKIRIYPAKDKSKQTHYKEHS